jgi:nicotinamide phosphoribosyltransferase
MTLCIPTFQKDVYKEFHVHAGHKDITETYGNFTNRHGKLSNIPAGLLGDRVCFAGLQYFILDSLINEWNEGFFQLPKDQVCKAHSRILSAMLGYTVDVTYLEQLHDLGYLPLEIKALEEGTMVPYGVPTFTTRNTHPEFEFLTLMIESVASNENWPISTSATTSVAYQAQAKSAMIAAGMDLSLLPFMIHDFSCRGMFGKVAGAMSGFGHLASGSAGTDTISSVLFAEKYYGADVDKELVGASVNATEHSVTCGALAAYVVELQATGSSRGFTKLDLMTRLGLEEFTDANYLVMAEFLYYHYLMIDVAPEGILAVVADTNDFWTTVTKVIPALKEYIMARNGKLVIRPDSGDPVQILCGIEVKNYEFLEDFNDEVRDECNSDCSEQGEYGFTESVDIIRLDGELVKVTVNVDYVGTWMEYGPKSYHVEDIGLVVEPADLTAEQKGLVECLWDTFGGTATGKDYTLLDEHIGAIYGDAITLVRQKAINDQLMAKGFAPQVVLGVGSYSFQYVTRDTHGSAMKATNIVLAGVDTPIAKDPKTDAKKKSAKGFLRVDKAADGTLSCAQNVTREEAEGGELKVVFLNGKLTRKTTLAEIRQRVQEQI